MTVLDAHTHMSGSAHDFLAMMDANGVDRAFVFTLDGLYVDPAPHNDRLAEFCSADPGRLVPFCTVHPRYPRAVQELRRCVTQLGMRGLKLHPWAQCLLLLDSSLDGIGKELERLNVPVVFHDGTPPNSSPLQVAEFARRHPTVPVILGHGGLHDLWKEAVYAAERYPNIYLTPSGMPMHGLRWALQRLPVERFVFGSDAGFGDSFWQPFQLAKIRSLRLRPDEENLILGGNAERILASSGNCAA